MHSLKRRSVLISSGIITRDPRVQYWRRFRNRIVLTGATHPSKDKKKDTGSSLQIQYRQHDELFCIYRWCRYSAALRCSIQLCTCNECQNVDICVQHPPIRTRQHVHQEKCFNLILLFPSRISLSEPWVRSWECKALLLTLHYRAVGTATPLARQRRN